MSAPPTIWKFKLDPFIPHVRMPQGAKLLHVHEQKGQVCVWAECDPMKPTALRHLEIVPTGNPLPQGGTYIGSAHVASMTMGMMLVFHVYDRGEVTP
jgi:hypothetical protein